MAAEPIVWSAYEYEYRPKSTSWYTVLFVIAGGLSVASFILGNFLFGVLVLIGAFAVALLASKPPLSRELTISQRGITVGKTFMPWSALESFWVEEDRNPPHLLIKQRNFFAPLIVMPVNDVAPRLIQDRLSLYLEEEELQEPLAHRITDWFEW
jgi:hypothetical protein